MLNERLDSMRVLVVGAGIIGSIYGWALAESGHQVVHLVRSGRAATMCDAVGFNMRLLQVLGQPSFKPEVSMRC